MSWLDKLPWARRHAEREVALHHTKAAVAESEKKLAGAEEMHARAERVKDRLDRTMAENQFRLRMERAFGERP